MSAVALAAEPTTPLILQMADGRFFNPSANIVAATREELLQKLGVSVDAAVPVISSTTSTDTGTMVSTSTEAEIHFPLKDAIIRGRAMLRELDTTTSTQIVKTDDGTRTLSVAIWDRTNDAITVKSVKLEKNAKKALVGGSLGDLQKAMLPTDQVVALRYPIYTAIKVNGKKRYQVEPIVYTPAYPSIHTPETVAWGKETLEKMLAQVSDELRRDGVHSRAFPQKLVPDLIDPQLVKSVAIIEHTDRATLKQNGQAAVETFYLTLAANPDNAYSYAFSPVGATGLVQFMPKTYAALVRLRPEAKLDPDFERAMSNPTASLKAEMVYLDDLLADLPSDVRDAYLSEPRQGSEYIAAAYNGGPARIKKAIANWELAMSGAGKSLAQLRSEHRDLRLAIADTKAKIKATTNPTTVSALKTKLADMTVRYEKNEDQQDLISHPLLKKETIDYVLKLREAMTLLRQEEPTVAQAVTTPLG